MFLPSFESGPGVEAHTLIPALRRLDSEDPKVAASRVLGEFTAGLEDTARRCLKNK